MKKLVGILVMTLLVATAVLPVVGTINILDKNLSSLNNHDIEIEWEKIYGEIYGDSEHDLFRDVKLTNDGGFIMVGVKEGQSHWLFKVDSNGDEEWSSTALPDTELWPRCYSVEQTSDGGFITAGCHQSDDNIGYNRCIWKVDSTGATEWLKTYDDPMYGWYMCIKETDDGGYIVCGEIDPDENNPSDFDMVLLKTDANGNVEWQQIWRYGEYGEVAYAVRQTQDGGYILFGKVESSNTDADIVIIKTDAGGNKEWEKTYGGDLWDQSNSQEILLTNDGGYIFLAETSSYGKGGNLDVWLIKTDSQGNMIWNKTIGGSNIDLAGGLDYTDDGGLIISGTYDFDIGRTPRSEGWIIKITENGDIEWQETFGYGGHDEIQGVCFTDDGGYVIAGAITSGGGVGAGGYDAWLIKIKSFENLPPEKPDQPSGDKRGLPDTEYSFSTNSVTDPDGDIVYYLWDWGDGNYSELLDTTEATHIYTTEDNFEIYVMAVDEFGGESGWSEPFAFSTPKNKALDITLLERLLARFPILKNIF